MPIPVTNDDLTVNPAAITGLLSQRVRALVISHLHGLVADIPAIRSAVGSRIAIIEDCAQAMGAYRSGLPAGAQGGDYAVFSLGPGKSVSAGEMGILASNGRERHLAALSISQHPIRQALSGVTCQRADVLIGRPSPFAAVLAAHKLTNWPNIASELRQHDVTVRDVVAEAGGRLLGSGTQVTPPGCVPIILDSDASEQAIRQALAASVPHPVALIPSGAVADSDLDVQQRERLTGALDSVRVATVRLSAGGSRT